MTREEAINEINKVFTSAYANYIVIALTEGATVSDIQHRWGRAYEAGVKDGLEQELCEDAVSRQTVKDTIFVECSGTKLDIDFAKLLLLQRAIKALPPVTPQESRWIPVTERLPEYNKEVLTCSDGGFIEIQSLENSCNGAYWEDQEGDWSYSGEVTAWMPLPEPYEEESEGENGRDRSSN